MKKYLVILASSFAFAATAAMATPFQEAPGQYNRDNNGQQDNHDQHDKQDKHGRRGNRDQQDNRGQQDNHGRDRYVRYDNRGQHDNRDRYDNHDHGSYGMHDRGRHEGWYKQGGRMPVEYRSDRYYVTDWRADHLREPPRGYRWVRSDNGDFLMIAITTGVIASILLSH